MTKKLVIARLPFESNTAEASRVRYRNAAVSLGLEHEEIYLDSSDVLYQLRENDIFVARWSDSEYHKKMYSAVVPYLESIGVIVIPRYRDLLLLDSKVLVELVFKKANVERPRTVVYFNLQAMKRDLESWIFPVILKENEGSGSSGVHLVESANELLKVANFRFYATKRLHDNRDLLSPKRWRRYAKSLTKTIFFSGRILPLITGFGWHPLGLAAPLVVQAFVPQQKFDIRVTIIGGRAFFFLRHNRKNDFRASGSGAISYDQSMADSYIFQAFKIADEIGLHTAAFDFLASEKAAVAIEVSPQFDPVAVHGCPGYWKRDGTFVQGRFWPELCEIEDALVERKAR